MVQVFYRMTSSQNTGLMSPSSKRPPTIPRDHVQKSKPSHFSGGNSGTQGQKISFCKSRLDTDPNSAAALAGTGIGAGKGAENGNSDSGNSGTAALTSATALAANRSGTVKTSEALEHFISDRAKIIPRRYSKLSSKDQRIVSQAVKSARVLGFLPFVKKGSYMPLSMIYSRLNKHEKRRQSAARQQGRNYTKVFYQDPTKFTPQEHEDFQEKKRIELAKTAEMNRKKKQPKMRR